MRVVTWNVLHRIHAMNWNESAIEAHADEAARIAAIAKRVKELAADAICLQEVSGDQLAALRAAMPEHAFYVHTYPRVPRLFRAPGPAPLADTQEHLVTILHKLVTRHTQSETYPGDKGKGFLLVELIDRFALVNTHVSYGEQHGAQCAQLKALVQSYRSVAIVGDFNADRATCRDHLGEAFAAALPAVDKPTRPRTDSGKADVIDHIFVSGSEATEVEVLPGRGLSDHNPVAATIAR